MAMVKLAFTSDLHLPITPADALIDLAGDLAEYAPDAVAVLGDIGESLGDIARCLKILTDMVTCPVLVVAGNHDLWLPERGPGRSSSRLRFEDDLPRTVVEAGARWLEGKSLTIQDVAVTGTIAWYDYSAAEPSLSVTPEFIAREKRYYNPDAYRIAWEFSDPEFAAHVAQPFLTALDRLEADPAVRQTVVVTHVPLLECQICRKPDDLAWAFSNAYFGNLTLGEQVIQRRKVTHIISGHTHVGRHAQVKLTDGRVLDARVVNSQYGKPAWVGITLGE